MFRIVSASKGRNTARISLTFHLLVSWFVRAETIVKSSKGLGGEMTLYVVEVGSHLSSQMCINRPFPTLYRVPFLNPMPPFSLYLQRFFQLTHAIFYSCFLCPHQNLLIMPSISSQSPLGRRKQLIVYCLYENLSSSHR